jgi:L-aspartate oxidase
VGSDDSPALHIDDTIAAGAGLCDRDAVVELAEQAPAAVRWLLELGTRFDRDPVTGEIELGREAAHSRRRVLHAGGDATGAEIERALVAAVRGRPTVQVLSGAYAIDLVVSDGRCEGAVVELAPSGPLVRLSAATTVIAAGGAGQLWATTSNPRGATADGLAMGLRAGAAVADLEFAQFHPTVLAQDGSDPFLVSEAVRGEGAYLRGKDGERFMVALHPLAELAPRDVVARGIQRQMGLDGASSVHLDLRHLDARAMRERFPSIAAELRKRGLDLATDLIPVAPAAHYFMGGIVAGSDGITSLPGLLAIGEAACTGVHGANRLASNSLLEGLVFGLHAAAKLGDQPGASSGTTATELPVHGEGVWPVPDPALEDLRASVQEAMSRHVAVVRDADGLASAATVLDAVLKEIGSRQLADRVAWETANLAIAARAVTAAAALRTESRGGHYRSDFPSTDPRLDGVHVAIGGDSGLAWRTGTLDEARASGTRS